jgi:2-dehydropantoate 2-reductase
MARQQKSEPQILIVGAGVTGSYYAARLQRSGARVTILCRPERQEYLSINGIVLREYYSETRSHLAVRTTTEARDEYDVVLLFLPYHRIEGLLPVLEQLQRARAFVFFGNNPDRFEQVKIRLGEDRVLAGIPAVVGVREKQVVTYADAPRASRKPLDTLWIGETEEPNNPAIRLLKRVFRRAQIGIKRCMRIEDRLLSHLARNLPLSLGLYSSGHKPRQLAGEREQLRRIVRAQKELAGLLRSRGSRIIPFGFRLLLLLPEGILVARIRRFLESPFAAIAFSAYKGEARKETAALYGEVLEMAKRNHLELEVLSELYRQAFASRTRAH